MSTPTNKQAYSIVKKFVELINLRDTQALDLDFGISNAVAEEIYASIDEYFEHDTKLSVAPKDHAFDVKGNQRPFFDKYETNEKNLGLECVLFADGSPGEAILHVEVFESDSKIKLYYKYIGS